MTHNGINIAPVNAVEQSTRSDVGVEDHWQVSQRDPGCLPQLALSARPGPQGFFGSGAFGAGALRTTYFATPNRFFGESELPEKSVSGILLETMSSLADDTVWPF